MIQYYPDKGLHYHELDLLIILIINEVGQDY